MTTLNLEKRLLEIGFSGTPEEADLMLGYIGLPKETTPDILEILLALNACVSLTDIERVHLENPESVPNSVLAARIAVALFPSGSEIRLPMWLKPVFAVVAQMGIKDALSWIEKRRQESPITSLDF